MIIGDADGNEVITVSLDEVRYPKDLDSALAWSPFGTDIALGGEGGLWFYSLNLGKLIQMSGSPEYTTNIRPPAYDAWSPDGSKVLIVGHRSNAGVDEVGIMPIVSGEVKMTSILADRRFTWAPDGQSFYVSSNYYGMTGILPSLMQVTSDELEITTLVKSKSTDDELLGRYLETAQVGPDNLLYYFYREGPVDFERKNTGLSMYRSNRDGITDRVLLRNGVYSGIDEILWAEDMSLAVIVGVEILDQNWTGSITILPTDTEEQAFVAPFTGYDLQWGQAIE